MTLFLLMRHGQPDYSGPNIWKGSFDMAPLTDLGEQQVQQQVDSIREFNPQIVISSPATRAVHSALVLRPYLQVPFRIEFDLHEWVPDVNFQWHSLTEVNNLLAEFKHYNGEWPPGMVLPWETTTHMRQRAFNVFRKYLAYKRVLAICHGRLMRTITGVEAEKTEPASFIPFQMDE
jgi:broad specificity phosphatase PhoE